MIEKYIDKGQDIKGEILSETKELLKKVDVTENNETEIGIFFTKLDGYEQEDKLQLLHDVLKDGEIMMGNGGAKKLIEVADDFSNHVEQDGSSWELKTKGGLPEDKQYLEQFLNQKNSSMAYFVQKTANFIRYEAARGYGMKANDVERIAEDKVLGNQTRRSLEGLKTWIESEHILTYDKIEEYKERDILKMKFVSKDFLVILKEKNKQLFDKFWEEKDEKFTPINGYNFTQAWSNNYVVKKEGTTDLNNTDENNIETDNKLSVDEGDAPTDLKVNSFLAKDIVSEVQKNGKLELDYFGEKKPIEISFSTKFEDDGRLGFKVKKVEIYDYFNLVVDKKHGVNVQIIDLLDSKGNFSVNKRNKQFDKQKEILKNKFISKDLVSAIKGKKYSLEDIFPNGLNAGEKKTSLVKQFFSLFQDDTLDFVDSSISAGYNGELRLDLNRYLYKDGDYSKYKKNKKDYLGYSQNEMLKIQPEKYQSFLSNGKFDGDGEKAFKNYLQEVVLDIVEKYGDKI